MPPRRLSRQSVYELVGEFVEVESGKKSDRPELARAIEACRKHKARLVIAKLDRLSRNLAFVATLMDSGVEFVAVDNPHANKLTIHILAAVAEHEREAISERTKAALAAAKARGKRLGTPAPRGPSSACVSPARRNGGSRLCNSVQSKIEDVEVAESAVLGDRAIGHITGAG
jgi:DNA invertase Pin-like site-specific DNA recombinase